MIISPDTKIKDIINSLLERTVKENSQYMQDSINIILNANTSAVVSIHLIFYASNGPIPEIISVELRKEMTSDDSKPH